jgi:hypothetical protein
MKLVTGSVVDYGGVLYVLAADVDAEPAVPPKVYPKLLWDKDGKEATADSPADEVTLGAEGFTFDHVPTAEELAALEPAPVVEPEPVAEPVAVDESEEATFGPPDDDTHEKRGKGSKKK